MGYERTRNEELVMTAKESNAISQKNAHALQLKMERQAKAQTIADKKANITRHKEWRERFVKELRQYIESATTYGRNEATKTMHSSTSSDLFYGEDSFLTNFEYASEFKSVITELEKDGYTITLIGRCVEHDESVAYMNSGGECGSETSYWTYDTILTVSW